MHLPFTMEVTVGPELVTSPYNHLHHARALSFLEEARVGFLKELGYPLEGFLNQQLFLVVTGIKIAYKREIGVGAYTVTCGSPRIFGKAASVEQKILNAKGKEAVVATVEFMCLSGATKRAIALPEGVAQAFETAANEERSSKSAVSLNGVTPGA